MHCVPRQRAWCNKIAGIDQRGSTIACFTFLMTEFTGITVDGWIVGCIDEYMDGWGLTNSLTTDHII